MACATGDQKLFYWDITKFWDMSSIESMYRSDLSADEKGISMLDRVSLTNNDSAFFDKLLKRGASEAQKVLQPMSRDLEQGYIFNGIPVYTVEEINDMETPEDYTDILIKMYDAGTLTEGTLVVVADQQVYFDGTDWVDGTALTTKYIFYNLLFPEYYDTNNAEPLDDMIFEFICLYVVKEWFRRFKYDLSSVVEEYDRIRSELKSLVNYRKSIIRISRTF